MKALVAALAVLVLLATPVAAQPSAAAPAPEPATHTQRYGWKIAVVDVASVALAVGGAFVFLVEFDDTSDEDGPSEGSTGPILWAIAAGGYLVGGPIIHSEHGNNRAAATSFALRAGLPLAGALVGPMLDQSSELSAGLVALGIVGAMVIDDAVLARREVRTGGSVAPYAAPTAGGGVTLGVAGVF